MTHQGGGSGVDARGRRRAHRGVLAVALALSALVHGTVLVYGRFTVPGGADATARRALSPDEADLRLVTLAPAPDASAVVPGGAGEEALSPAPVATLAPPEATPLEIPGVTPVAADRLAAPMATGAATAVATFDLKPVATPPGPGPATAVQAEAKGPGLFRRVLGGILKGVSLAVSVPCGPDGSPGADPAAGGAPVIPDGGGMAGLPGVTNPGIPTGPEAVGMPEPQVIGIPSVPDATFGGSDGPVAGAGAGALGGLIGCDDSSGRTGGGLGGGIFRPGGGGSP